MNIHEYQAKQLFRSYGINVLKGDIAFNIDDAVKIAEGIDTKKWVVKAQIHAGGRGKGGGVKIANSIKEVEEYSNNILGMNLITPQTGVEGKKVLISAGPTIEELDPVRYISNHSSGKMGYSLAETALSLGAEVKLISGPTNQSISSENIKIVHIKTGNELLEAIRNDYNNSDIVIMAAAVSDYKPIEFSEKKIKKDNNELNIKFEKTTDILFELGQNKKNQILVGFALENNNELSNAINKLEKKNLDLIVLNSLNDEGAGFGYDTNKITVVDCSGNVTPYKLKKKNEVADDVFKHIIELM